MNKKANRFSRILTASVLCLALVLSSLTAVPAYGADGEYNVIFNNTGSGEEAISLTAERSFTATLKVDGMTKAELEEAIAGGKVTWTLSREKGMQDEDLFPYQFLGGAFDQWQTVKTPAQDKQPMFINIRNTAVEDGEDIYLQLTFDNRTLFGYNGIDGRSRSIVRNKILDYTGEYILECAINGTPKGNTAVQVRPYDSFRTQSQINSELDQLAGRANAAGLYAEVQEIGSTDLGLPIKAMFLAADNKDLSDYQALTEREETEPAALQALLESKEFNYKVPVMYSNVHADEVVGSDACMDFLEAIVSAAEGDGVIPYTTINGLTKTGEKALKEEMAADGKVWSDLIAERVTGVGYIQGNGSFEPTDPSAVPKSDASVYMTRADMNVYYIMDDTELVVDDVLDDVFFIVVPSENADGKTAMTRTNGNYFDLNRDNSFQTQAETRAMTALIAKWNPVSFHEIHGYYNNFQVEPCSPTHEPNAEYDLFMDTALAQGENFGAAAISNNKKLNSFQMPMRDYLTIDKDGKKEWYPFDDMSTSYTPQYSFMHGCNGYTVELAYGSQEAVDAVKYGFIGNADFVSDHKAQMFWNQMEFFQRGLENIDSSEIRKYYVSQSDEPGAEAGVFRKKYAENNNFFPEYYAIPIDASVQEDTQSARDMIDYLLRNDVRLKQLNKDVTVNEKTYKKGTIIVDMHQAKRNMANSALYTDVVISNWSDLYSEPLTAFSQLRGFDMDVITKAGAFSNDDMDVLKKAPQITTVVTGEGGTTIISNNSLDAVKAVNEMLKNGKAVSFITDGENKGDFAVATDDFAVIKEKYTLIAKSTTDSPAAKEIPKSVKIYVPGQAAEFADIAGSKYGVQNYTDRHNNTLGWDLFAYGIQLGFELTNDLKEADIIVGGCSLTNDEKAAVKNGKPYIGYSRSALIDMRNLGIGLDFVNKSRYYDALTTVTYEDPDSLITAKYAAEKDNIMYGYGGSYISKIPDGAKVLIKTTADDPIEGFMDTDYIKQYKNQITAIEYKSGGFNITLFANTMTNKAHQQDDYRFVTNAIFANMIAKDNGGSSSHHGGSSASLYKIEKGKITNTGNSNGTLSFSSATAKAGAQITVTIKSNVGYEPEQIAVRDANDKEVSYKDKQDGIITFEMPASNVKVDVSFVPVFGKERSTPPFGKVMTSMQNIKLDGKDIGLQCYNVDGYNYVKLRDVAYALSGTPAKFGVDTGENNGIIAVPGGSYNPVGGEMTGGTDLSATCVVSRWVIIIDDIPRYLNVYNIGDNNYFMLRDLGELFDFGVDYDATTNTALITTN